MHKKRSVPRFLALFFIIITNVWATSATTRSVPYIPPVTPPSAPPPPPIGPDGRLSEPFSAFSEGATLIGSVFEDLNADGFRQKGERGIPGVRLMTPTGLVIETDAYGRFHIPDPRSGDFIGRGHNIAIKLDPASLPQGARITTENPRIYRVSAGALNRVDFGVLLPKQTPYVGEQNIEVPHTKTVTIRIGSILFDSDKACIRPDQVCRLDRIAKIIKKYKHGTIVITGHTDARAPKNYNTALARRRAETLYKELRHRIGAPLMRHVSIIYDASCKEIPFNPKYDWWGKPNPPRRPHECSAFGTPCHKKGGVR